MCVVSMVSDYYQPLIIPWEKKIFPHLPQTDQPLEKLDFSELEALLNKYNEALAAAKKVDDLTRQPDCIDPEKLKLQKRIEDLEAEVKKLKKSANKRRRNTSKGV